MIAQTRDPWQRAWQVATGGPLLAALLLVTAAGLAVASWLPQAPSVDPAAYARWLAETRARFGETTSTLESLGLFRVAHTPAFRTTAALLAACLLLRLVESADRLRCARGAAALAGLLAHAGALLLLAGLAATLLWGRRIGGLVLGAGERAALPGTETWIALGEDARDVSHGPGVAATIEERVPGVQASASDAAGQPLAFRQSPTADPVARPTLAITEDRFLAVTETPLVVRLAALPGEGEPGGSVLVQVYRSPPGQLVEETVVEKSAAITVDGVALQFTAVPHARLVARLEPGAWPAGVGVAILAAGLLLGGVQGIRRRRRGSSREAGSS